MTNAPAHFDQQRTAFIHATRGVAASVMVVTTNGKACRRGAKVSAFCSVPADSPSILVCLNKSSGIADEVTENGLFNVNILRNDQAMIVRRFAGNDDVQVTDCFKKIYCIASDVPEINGAMVLCCETISLVPSTSHMMVIAHVNPLKIFILNRWPILMAIFTSLCQPKPIMTDVIMSDLVPCQMPIDRQWVDAADGSCFESIDPSTGKVWASVPEATTDDFNYAVKAAERAMYEDLQGMGYDVDNPAEV